MARPDWARVREVFEAALELPDTERASYLQRECDGDSELREHVDRLLAADANATAAEPEIARQPSIEIVSAGLENMLVGRKIGSYEIRSLLGTGGMGTVFEAVQDSPHRVVALKTLRAGQRSDDMRRRFEYEAEILGKLRHPAIAQIYETGTLEDAETGVELPYFAIEFVPQAAPLDQFVRSRKLGLRAMLEFFLSVLDGVLHGHELGVVHRDLKPANILVDDEGRPKIIDFGIARASDLETTQLTRTGQVLGTLSYMAPEQLVGDASTIGTRADIYALGVILYELLTGQLPFDPSGTTLTEFVRRVQNDIPPPPSGQPGRPATGHVELDWITRTAMAADPNERYASVSELTADIQRFLRHEPVSVGPLTTGYLIRKFVRRHRVLATAGAAVFLAVVLGAIGMGWQWQRAQDALVVANQETVRAQTVTEYFTGILQADDLFDDDSGSREPTLRNAVDAAAERIDQLNEDPIVEAIVLFNLGNIKRSRGDVEESRGHLERSLELRVAEFGEDHRDVAEVLNSLALTCDAVGETELARRHYERALEIVRNLDTTREPLLGRIHMNLGSARKSAGENEEAEQHFRDSIAAYAALQDPKPGEQATVLSHLAGHLSDEGRVDDAEQVFRDSLAAFELAGRSDHPFASMTRGNLAGLLIERGDHDEALVLMRSAHEALTRTLGEDHETTAIAAHGLASTLLETGAYAEAEPYASAADAYFSKRYGDADPRAEAASRVLLGTLDKLKRWEEALEVARRRLDAASMIEDLGPRILGSVDYGRILQRVGQFEESERQLRSAIAFFDDNGIAPPLMKTILEWIVEVCEADGRPEDANDARERLRKWEG